MSDRIATVGVLAHRLEQLVAGDPESTRLVYALVLALVVVGILLIVLAIWMIRRTRADMALLGPLERMGDSKWRKRDPSRQQAMLDEVRPPGAESPTARPPLPVASAAPVISPATAPLPPPVDPAAPAAEPVMPPPEEPEVHDMPVEPEVDAPLEAEVDTQPESEGETPSESEVQMPSESEVQTPSESEVQTPSESEVQMPSESEVEPAVEPEVELTDQPGIETTAIEPAAIAPDVASVELDAESANDDAEPETAVEQ